jgi:hypothetical protein
MRPKRCAAKLSICVQRTATRSSPLQRNTSKHLWPQVGATTRGWECQVEWAAPRRMRSVQLAAWHVRSLAALGHGDFKDAYHEAIKITPPGVIGSHNPFILSSVLDFVEAAMRTNRGHEAAAHARSLQDAGVGALSSRLALVEKVAMAIATDDEDAIGLFEEALTIPEIDRWPFDLARTHLAFGECGYDQQGDRTTALSVSPVP